MYLLLKLLISAVLLTLGFFLNQGLTWLLRRVYPGNTEKARSKLVLYKNLVRLLILALLVAVWASQISGALLSVAAIAGALLITGKEVVLCLFGYINLSIAKPYRVGDYVEIGNQSGRVLDIHLFSTRLFEIGPSGRYTGRVLSVPNLAVFAQTIKHSSSLGAYNLYCVDIILPFRCDSVRAEQVARQVAEKVAKEFMVEADRHFDRLEFSDFVDLPSASPAVIWQAYNEVAHKMTVRFACPSHKRGDVEQAIYREFWQIYGPVV